MTRSVCYSSGSFGTSFPLDVPAAFVAGALIGVAADWLQRGCPRSPLQMTILTKPLLIALRATATPGPE